MKTNAIDYWLHWEPGADELPERLPSTHERTDKTDKSPSQVPSVSFVGSPEVPPGALEATESPRAPSLCPGEQAGARDSPRLPEVSLESHPLRIPAGAVLMAPRYNGGSQALANPPTCWCCRTPYQLDHLQLWREDTIAWLEPACGCLDVAMCLTCGACKEHCGCTTLIDLLDELESDGR